jgi:hypothetical protein
MREVFGAVMAPVSGEVSPPPMHAQLLRPTSSENPERRHCPFGFRTTRVKRGGGSNVFGVGG